MKKLVVLLVSVLLLTSYAFSQQTKWVLDTEKNYLVPVGPCQYEDLRDRAFSEDMNIAANNYNLNADATVELAQVMASRSDTQYDIDVFFGAWCGDSQTWLPRFMMFAYTMEYKYQQPFNNVRLYGCDREKNCGIEGFKPEFVPTFMVYRVKNNERTLIGSVVEEPQERIENDILNIIKNN